MLMMMVDWLAVRGRCLLEEAHGLKAWLRQSGGYQWCALVDYSAFPEGTLRAGEVESGSRLLRCTLESGFARLLFHIDLGGSPLSFLLLLIIN